MRLQGISGRLQCQRFDVFHLILVRIRVHMSGVHPVEQEVNILVIKRMQFGLQNPLQWHHFATAS